MQADEQVGLAVVGERRAVVERDRLVGVAGQQHADAEPALERAFSRRAMRQRDVLLERAGGALDAGVVAAVAGVDDDRPQAAGGRLAAGGGRSGGWRNGQAGGRRRAAAAAEPGSAAAGSRSTITCAAVVLRPTTEARYDPKRGPTSMRDRLVSTPRGRIACTSRCGATAGSASVERVGVEPHEDAAGFLRDRVGRLRADRQTSRASARPTTSWRTATRGTRTSPTSTSREFFRTSSLAS